MYKDIEVLIIGTDINAYYMSRCYHELTGKKADIIGKAPMAFTSNSKITNVTVILRAFVHFYKKIMKK